jgi:GntR family transcriptional repressor for pyruvate dehydrogenase complex
LSSSSSLHRLYEHIVEQIRAQIVSGQLKAGDQLPSERELAQTFSVSRTAIREAVKTLREKGLVEVRLGRGTYVVNDTSLAAGRSLNLAVRLKQPDGWVDLVEARMILEPDIAALAAERATTEQIDQLQGAVNALTAASGAVDAWASMDTEFHNILAHASQNVVMPILLNSVIESLHDQRRSLLMLDGRLDITRDEHQRIIDAIAERQPEAAREAMRAHIERVQHDVRIVVELAKRGTSST